MTLEEAIAQIETLEFSARLNVASSLNVFLDAVRQEQAVRVLVESADSANVRTKLYDRITALVDRSVDPEYENPWDTAFAAYLLVLNWGDPGLPESVIRYVGAIPQCWWATQVAGQLLSFRMVASGYDRKRVSFAAHSTSQCRRTPLASGRQSILFQSKEPVLPVAFAVATGGAWRRITAGDSGPNRVFPLVMPLKSRFVRWVGEEATQS